MSNNFLSHLFRFWLRAGGLIGLAVRRIFYRPGLSTLALLAVALAVGLVTSTGFFSQAVYRQVLLQELAQMSKTTGRPPFSMRIYTIPDSQAPLSLEAADRLTKHVGGTMAGEIGLPLLYTHLEVESGGLMIQSRVGEARVAGQSGFLGNVNLAYIEGVADKLDIVGDPLTGERSADLLDVWVYHEFGAKAGMNVGDAYNLGVTVVSEPLPIRVRGFWKPLNHRDPYWFTDPDLALRDVMIVRYQDYVERVEPMIPSKTRFAAWHIMLDETSLVPARSAAYLRGFERAMIVIGQYLPGAKLDVSPIKPLDNFVQRNRTLTILLLGFNLPSLGFLLYFLVLTSVIVAQWQHRETALLVSRGMGRGSVVALTLVEELVLFVVGVPLGVGLGVMIARLMGQTASFMAFASRPPMPVSLQGLNLPLIAGALAATLLARLWPAWSSSRRSVVEEEREQARPLRNPFWYRYYIDLILVLPTLYAYDQLRKYGSLAMLVNDRPADLYRDPLLVLVPALFILTASLLAMRFFPLIVSLLDKIANLVPWIVPHLALRQLGRQTQSYINPLLLIMISLGLGIYTFALAASLDQWLVDRMYYRAGTHLSFQPLPLRTGESGSSSGAGEQWALPIQDFLGLPGVASGTRVGDYRVRTTLSGNRPVNARLLGVERAVFPQVAWFRRDLASESLGALMNRLAARQDAVLVSEEMLAAGQLRIGDPLQVQLSLPERGAVPVKFTVVGTYKYFPTVYADQPTAIANLDYLFSLAGGPMQHSIWLRLLPEASGEAVLQALRGMGIEGGNPRDAEAMITEEQAKTERVGVFGTLTVGFLAASAMALAGLLINTYASLNERLHRFAVLHAMGVRRRQILGQVLLEYFFLTAYGAAGGAFIGATATRMFSPFFRVTGVKELPLPPLLPVVPEDLITQMAILFAGVMVILEMAVISFALIRRLARLLTLRSQV